MALVNCPECGRENVSSSAVACPSCGFPIAEHFKNNAQNLKVEEDKTETNTLQEYDLILVGDGSDEESAKKILMDLMAKGMDFKGVNYSEADGGRLTILKSKSLSDIEPFAKTLIDSNVNIELVDSYGKKQDIPKDWLKSSADKKEEPLKINMSEMDALDEEARRQEEARKSMEAKIKKWHEEHDHERQQPSYTQSQPSTTVRSTKPVKDDIVRCPRCNSAQITTGARGGNGFWGLIGASKTVNRCAKCGYTWQPSYLLNKLDDWANGR